MSGIKTFGPNAQKAADNAQQYQAGIDQYEDATGQGAPQVYGQEEPMGNAQGPLTPQETAARMPQTKDAMKKLIDQHMLRGATPKQQNHYDNYVQDSREKRAAEKAFLRSQAPEGGGTGYRGMDGMSMGGMESGPTVRKIGGYTFVSGKWRPADAAESAQLDLMRSKATNERMRPALEAMDINSRRTIAQSAMEGRARENEANRGIQKERLGETVRHNTALEKNASADDAARLAAQAEKELEAARSELDDLTAQLREREGIADEQVEKNSRGWLNPKSYVPESLVGPDVPDREPYLDDRRDRDKFVREKGSFASRAQRAAMLLTKLEDALKGGKYKGYIPDDQYDFLDNLRKKYPATKLRS